MRGDVARVSPTGLDASGAATGATPEPDRIRATLEARARRLARRPPPEGGDGESIEVLVFDLGAERYAVETRLVRQVVRPPSRTPVPGGDELLAGVVNLDGEILAVFDLGLALGVGGRREGDGSRIVVLGAEHDEFGVDVDLAREVTTLRLDCLSAPPETDEARDLVRGIAPDATVVLDGEALLADGRFLVNRVE